MQHSWSSMARRSVVSCELLAEVDAPSLWLCTLSVPITCINTYLIYLLSWSIRKEALITFFCLESVNSHSHRPSLAKSLTLNCRLANIRNTFFAQRSPPHLEVGVSRRHIKRDIATIWLTRTRGPSQWNPAYRRHCTAATVLWPQQTVRSSCWSAMFNGIRPERTNKWLNSAYLQIKFVIRRKIHSNTVWLDQTFSCWSQVTMMF